MLGNFIYSTFFSEDSRYVDFKHFETNSFWGEKKFRIPAMLVTNILFLLPLCYLRDLTKLRFTSLIGLAMLLFIFGVLVAQLPHYQKHYWDTQYKEDKPETHLNIYNIDRAFTSDLKFFGALATFFFSYSCQHGALPIFNKLSKKSIKRIDKVFSRSVLLDFIFFAAYGVIGYLTQPIGLDGLILNRTDIDKDSGSKDVMMSVCRLLIFFLIICKIPINFNAMRISIMKQIYGTTEFTNTQ